MPGSYVESIQHKGKRQEEEENTQNQINYALGLLHLSFNANYTIIEVSNFFF